MGAPLTIGETIVFQKFGMDVYNIDSFDSQKELKKSIDFVGYSVTGEYSSANYSANIFKNVQGDFTFKGKESFEIEFEDTDDPSFL
jgi:Golgi nucleoside diphosphatase